MGKQYSEELNEVPGTLQWAADRAIDQSMAPPWDQRPIIVIGSGGSFTAADFGARAFQAQRQHLCIAVTPLEYLQRSTEFGSHHLVLLSAEGKNSDIRSAAAAALREARTTTAITFQASTPVSEVLSGHLNARLIEARAPWGKDGYLATNSLVASCIVLASVSGLEINISAAIDHIHRTRRHLREHGFIGHVMSGRKILAIHGTAGAPAAIDLESKFAEAAFGTVQRTDLRQFAHGRHIQLVHGQERYAVVAYVNGAELDLWAAVQAHLPEEVPVLTCVLPTGLADAAVQGLLFSFAMVEAIGNGLGVDPGQPKVPEFARQIYALEASRYIRRPDCPTENAKIVALFNKGVGVERLIAAMDAYVVRLANARIRGLVLDFDGTCCETSRRREGIQPELVAELERLLDGGMVLAFASGRGDSLHTDLRKKLPERFWDRVLLGCHSGSSRVRLSEPWQEGKQSSEITSVEEGLALQGVDDKMYTLRIHAGQFTIESACEQDVQRAFLAASGMARTHPGWRTFRSAHSIDVLAPEANKVGVAQWLAQELGADSGTELLRIGDRGEAFGNDTELLGSGLSLSADGVSPDEGACWIFGDPYHSAAQRTLAYLQAIRSVKHGIFVMNFAALSNWSQEAKISMKRFLGTTYEAGAG